MKVWKWIGAFYRDPFFIQRGIDRDWSEFKAMTSLELVREFDGLLDNDPYGARLRRLCDYLALQWVTERLPSAVTRDLLQIALKTDAELHPDHVPKSKIQS